MNPRRAERLGLAGLAALLAWQLAALSCYIALDRRAPAWDQANHLEVAWKYFRWAGQGRWSAIWRYAPNGTMPPFPPLYHLALACVYRFTQAPAAFLWVNGLYLVVLAVSVYALGRQLSGPLAGLAAAALIVCSPLVQELLRTQLVDLALMACVAAAYWALLACDEFQDAGRSLLFGLACGVGMLHKWSFFSYLLPAAVVWARALHRPGARRHALLAALLGVGMAAPWYLIRLPLVLVRLTQATSDFVVPFWKGGAFFLYVGMARAGLGLPLFILGAWTLWRAWRSRQAARRLLAAWALVSYVFWALLPNRQPRFLAPGLSSLAVVAAAAPAPVLWAAAGYQAFAAARGSTELSPRSEDWRAADVLAAIDESRSPRLQAVSIIANAERFNKLDFIWYADLAGMDRVAFRGVNDIPWELSDWVVFKTGALGPDAVTREFLPAQAAIERRGGWFSRAFEERRRWSLPDGSAAVLYGRRRLKDAPLQGAATGPVYFSSLLQAPSASVTPGAWDRASGAYRSVTIEAPLARAAGLDIAGLRLRLDDALVLPDVEDGAPGFKVVRIGRAEVLSASVTDAALRRRLPSRLVGVRELALDGSIRASVSLKGLPVSAEVAIENAPDYPCRAVPRRLALAGVPLPVGPLLDYGANGPLFELSQQADRLTVRTVFGLFRDVPFPIAMAGCSAHDGRLSVP